MEVSLVTVIGLYFLADGFAELIRFAFLGVVIHGLDGSVTLKSVWTNLSRFEIVTVIQSMVKLTIGTALVLGRGATVATLRQARHWAKKWRAWPDEPEQVGRAYAEFLRLQPIRFNVAYWPISELAARLVEVRYRG